MAKVIVMRSSEFTNRARAYKIFIDDQQVGTLKNGGSGEFEVAEGTHTIYAKVDWCYSPARTFTLGTAERKTFNVGTYKAAQWVLFAALAVLLANILVKTSTGNNYVQFLLIPLFLVMLYYMTLGRRKYLTLVEDI